MSRVTFLPEIRAEFDILARVESPRYKPNLLRGSFCRYNNNILLIFASTRRFIRV